tara:strand:+ start:112518 stop:113537 length:1020 start_codon:yes stop_codon:yes gene_type:complete
VSNLVFQALEVLNHLAPTYNLDFLKDHHKKKLHLHGAGKTAPRMATELKDLGLKFKSEIIIGPHSGHPIPDLRSTDGAQKLIKAAKSLGENDLVLFCLSGGASSLMELPIEGIELEELQRIYGDLLLSGKRIHEINSERKKISQVKGGKLGDLYLPAHVHCFIESDVEGDIVSDVGSSPIIGGDNGHSYEVTMTKNHLKETAKKLFSNFHIEEVNLSIEENIKTHMDLLEEHSSLITLGEASVNVTKKGLGGRNTHWVALMGLELMKLNKDFELLSFGTDGRDGDTGAAGAFFDGRIGQEELKAAIENFDTYNLFKKHKLLIEIAETGYNLNDFRMIKA